jgi:hypothetical protein
VNEAIILDIVKRALPKIVQDYANWEIDNKAEVLITDKSKDLNIVGALLIRKGNDVFKVITVRKKKDFVPKPGTRHYLI